MTTTSRASKSANALVGLGGAAFGVFFGVVGTIYTATAGYWGKNRELDLEMVRLSVSILSAPASSSESDQLQRRFAVHALRQFSGVDLTDDELAAWAKAKGSFPRITTLAEVCGTLAFDFSLSFGYDKDDADREYKTLALLGCITPPTSPPASLGN